MRETDQFYFFWKHQFGQWSLREIVEPGGQAYICCEQYMMHKKALLFGDQETARAILEEKNPADQQRLGRQVRNYDLHIWNRNKFGIVWYGNFLKFSQHPDLRKRLLETNEKILAEASPEDLVWGVGFAADDDRILNQEHWRGGNLLGQVLMSVRAAVATIGHQDSSMGTERPPE